VQDTRSAVENMHNPIKRLYKPNVPSRIVSLSIASASHTVESAVCEVIEYDVVMGMEQWDDSIFLRDFEDSVLTAPAPLAS
jgi:hypothetical protein